MNNILSPMMQNIIISKSFNESNFVSEYEYDISLCKIDSKIVELMIKSPEYNITYEDNPVINKDCMLLIKQSNHYTKVNISCWKTE